MVSPIDIVALSVSLSTDRHSFLRASIGWIPDALSAGAKLAVITMKSSSTPAERKEI